MAKNKLFLDPRKRKEELSKEKEARKSKLFLDPKKKREEILRQDVQFGKQPLTESQKKEMEATGFATRRARQPQEVVKEPVTTPIKKESLVKADDVGMPESIIEERKVSEPFLTEEEKQRQLASDLGVDPESLLFGQDVVKEQLSDLDKKLQFEREKIERQKAEDLRLSEKQTEAVRFGESAFKSQAAIDRGLGVAGTQLRTLTGISRQAQEKLQTIDSNLQAAESAREEALRRLELAERSGKQELVQKEQERLDKIEIAKQQLDNEFLDRLNQERALIADIQSQKDKDILATISSLGAGLEFIPDDSLLDMIDGSNIGFPLISGYKNALIKQREAQAADDVQAAEKWALEKEKIEEEIKQIGIVKDTADIQNFNYYKRLKETNPELSEEYARTIGITDAPKSKFDVEMDKLKLQEQKYKNTQLGNKIQQEINQMTSLKNIPNTENLLDKLAEFETGDTPKRGQCGEFVNDMLGKPGLFQDYLFDDQAAKNGQISKISKINSNVPSVGSVFISMNGGVNGHVGFIESIDYQNNTATIVDCNKERVGKVNRRTVPLSDLSLGGSEKVLGYYNPSFDQQNKNEITAKTKYKESLLPLYAKFNMGEFTSADWKAVKELGINNEEFSEQALASKVISDVKGANFAKEIISMAEALKAQPGRTAAAFFLPGLVPFTDAKDFQRTFDSFVSKLSLENLISLKKDGATFGALSNQELNFIKDAATSLSPGMTDEKYAAELDKIINKMTKAIGEDAYLDDVSASYNNPINSYLDSINL